MPQESRWNRFLSLQYLLPLGLGLLGLIFFICGLIVFSTSKKQENRIQFDSVSDSQNNQKTANETNVSTLTVDIGGAINNPGVYTLPQGSRISDALREAGGIRQDADRLWVAKNLNQAAKLSDGTKVYIPQAGEQGVLGSTVQGSLININTATQQQLEELPGIGQVTAGKIIKARPYEQIEDLLEKKVVSQRVFETIKERINTY